VSRFLFVVPSLAERARPTASVGRELARRGHEVAWTGATVAAPPLGGLRSPAGLLMLWDDFLLPLARDMLPTVRAVADGFRPDALVVDHQALAGAAVGHLSGRPWATVVPTSAGLADPLWDLPEIARGIRRRTRRFLGDAGLDDIAAARLDPQRSPHLVVAFSTEELAGPVDDPSGRHAFVGPSLDARVDDVPFNWARLDGDRPLVVVAIETPPWRRGARIYPVAAEALGSLDVQGVIVGPPDLVADPPPNVAVVPRAPLRALVRRAAAVVCDGGHATVCEALAHGVPLVVAPLLADQPLVADQVVRAGAAVPVTADRVSASDLRWAVRTALTDARLRRHAQRLGDSFTHAGGSSAAADRLEALLLTGRPVRAVREAGHGGAGGPAPQR